MPGVYRNPDVGAMLAQMATRLRGIETQQQNTISNSVGLPVLNIGLVPGSNPPAYGLQFVNPTTGVPIMFVGEDGSGNTDVVFYNANGNPVVVLSSKGLELLDNSGNVQATLGAFNSSLPSAYGLSVLPYGGSTTQQVAGSATSSPGTLLSTTVTSWTVPTGASTLTLLIGASGQALVTVSGQASTGIAGQEALIGCQVDGSGAAVSALVSCAAGGTSVGTSASLVISVTANMTHTFAPVVETASNGASTCSFQSVTVTVTPL